MNFSDAYNRLKKINERLNSEEFIDIDEIIELQKEAEKLYEFCRNKLEKLENQ